MVLNRRDVLSRFHVPHLHWGVRLLDARVDPFSLLRIGAP
jgi:hypothetical protein